MALRLFGCGLLAAAFVAIASLTSADNPAEQEPDRVRPLLEQRVSILADLVEYDQARFDRGLCDLRRVNDSKKRLLAARLDLVSTKAKRLVFLEQALVIAQVERDQIEQQVESASVPKATLIEARLAVLDARIALERERAK